jgi:methyl-accepting chemotaxis protein
MKWFSKMKIRTKLPAFMVVLAVLSSVSLVAVGANIVEQNAWEKVQNQFQSVIADRSSAVQTLARTIEADVNTLVTVPSAGVAAQRFGSAWSALGADSQDFTRSTFITDNPNPPEERMNLDRGKKTVPYNIHHAAFHPSFRSIMLSKGYADMYLLNSAGFVIYSVAKRDDYATNLLNPEEETSLSRLASQLQEVEPGTIMVADFDSYPAAGGASMAFAGARIESKGQIVGSLIVAVPGSFLDDIVGKGEGLGQGTEVYLVGADGKYRAASRHAGGHQAHDVMPTRDFITAAAAGEGGFQADVVGLGGQSVVAYSQPLSFAGNTWVIAAEENRDDVLGPVRRSRDLLLMIALAGTVMISILGWLFARSITKPFSRICADMQAVSHGDLDTAVDAAGRHDEFGEIGRTLVSMQDDLKLARAAEEDRAAKQQQQQQVVENLSDGLVRLAKGDFSQQIEEPFPAEYEQLRADFNSSIDTLNATVQQVIEASTSIRSGASEISQASDDLSRRTESQAATLEQTAAAIDELTESVRSAADGARNVESTVQEARQEAESSGEVVQSAVTAMSGIEESSNKISQIISVIDDIAFQTNLLALNAGVEAARAGEAGRGFAVVASEVRALAQRSSDAAMEIKTLISDSSRQVEQGVDLVGRAGEALHSIVSRVGHISQLVSGIAEGAQEQSTGLHEINTGVTQLDQVTQQNAAMVEEATAAGHMLNSDATKLAELVAHFTISGGAAQPQQPQFAAHPPVAESTAEVGAEVDPWAEGTAEPAPEEFAATGTDGPNKWQDF